jgi:hypothetical protein
MDDEEVLQFQGDQSPAVQGVEWHCEDGEKCLWTVSLKMSAQFFVEIRQDFWIKKTQLNISFRGDRTTFPIPLHEEKTRIITFRSDERSSRS